MSKLRSLLLRASASVGAASICLLSIYLPGARAQVSANICGQMMEEYSLAPYRSWGSTPENVKPIWDASDCNHKVCQYMQDKYGVIPYKNWGRLPQNLQKVWDTPEVDCNHHVSRY
jgi:hypothetical protein